MSGHTLNITTTPEFAPGERLRAALERVIATYDADLAQRTDDDEVSGFGTLQIGNLGATVAPSGTSGWADGCWGYDKTGCGWYVDSETGESCVWNSWKR